MLKKLIIILILMALVLPAGAGAVTRPRTLLERCTLRHDWSDDFGLMYTRGARIASQEGSIEIPDDFPSNVTIPTSEIPTWTIIQSSLAASSGAGGVWLIGGIIIPAECKASIDATLTAASASGISKVQHDALAEHCAGKILKLDWILKEMRAATMQQALAYVVLPDAAVVCMLDLLETIGDWIFVIVLIIAVIFLIFAGYVFITGAGAPEKITKARNMLVWGLVGVAVAILAKGLITLVEQLIT